MSSSKDGRPPLCASISSSRSFSWMSSFCASRSRIFAVLFEVVSVAAKRKRLRMYSSSHTWDNRQRRSGRTKSGQLVHLRRVCPPRRRPCSPALRNTISEDGVSSARRTYP